MFRKIVISLFFICCCITVYVFLIIADIAPDAPQKFMKFKSKCQIWFYSHIADPNFRAKIPYNPQEIDIVIPVISKDLEPLKLNLKNLHSLLMHPIGNVYLIAPHYETAIRQYAKKNNYIFISEEIMLPSIAKTSSGWIKQQLLKLSADTVVVNEHFLVIDADTILIRPHVFIRKGKTIFNFSTEYGTTRKAVAAQFLKLKKVSNLDLVCHHMLFSKIKLKEMKKYIESIYNKPWYEAILDLKDISEYEIYGNYMFAFHRQQIRITLARNDTVWRTQLKSLEHLMISHSQHYKSLSFHHFNKAVER